MKVLFTVMSASGNTRKVCDLFAARLRERGAECETVRIREDMAAPDVRSADVLVVGYPVHGFNAPQNVVDLAKDLPECENKGYYIIKTSGSIQAAQGEECTVVANVSGIISLGNLPFQDGVAVKKGQSILSIASKNLSSGDIAIRLRSTYETAKKEYERTKKLVPQQIVSQKEYEQAKMAYENAKAAYEAIKNNENNKGIALLSPIDGYLKNLLVKEGDYVTEGQPVVTVTQNRKLTLKAEISEKYYALLSSVKSANFRTPYEETVYKLSGLNGRIISYGKSANDNSYYVPVIFEFDNKGAIIPGTFVEIWLLGKEKDNILTVPTSALIEEQGLYFVYRQTNEDGYMKTEVKLGSGNGEEFEVLSGLKAGDVVVTKGAYQIKLASASNIIPAHNQYL